MARKKRLYDATQTHIFIECPACGQKYAIFSLLAQDDEEIACTECNAIFRLRISGDEVEPQLITPATGGARGPAEGPQRR
ncbi:MAG: hypothetical protein ACREQ3_18615 [Candidatus Binatia bacterium]